MVIIHKIRQTAAAVAITICVALLSSNFPLTLPAFAVSYNVVDQASCEALSALGGTLSWDGSNLICHLVSGMLVVSSGNTLSIGSGTTLTIDASSQIVVSGDTLNINHTGKLLVDSGGALHINSGTVNINGDGIVSSVPSGILEIKSGGLVDNSGSLRLNNDPNGDTILNINTGATLTNTGNMANSGDLFVYGIFNNVGTVSATGGGTFEIFGTLNNSGNISGGQPQVHLGGTLNSSGTYVFQVAGRNFGTINISGLFTVNVGFSFLENRAGGVINVNNGGILDISSTDGNSGLSNEFGATVYVRSGGTINVNSGARYSNLGSTFICDGTINVSGTFAGNQPIDLGTECNQPPVANDATLITDEDTPVSIVLTASDFENDPLQFTVVSQPLHGMLSGTAPNLTYTPNQDFFGSDSFTFVANDGTSNSTPATVLITINPVEDNQAPDCSGAQPSHSNLVPPIVLWPPNHNLKDIIINGVTDADGDLITITITSIRQDEPTSGLGDGDQSPDGFGIGTNTAQVRVERSGTGDGRVYHIGLSADDGNGGTCTGEVQVSVPLNQSDLSSVDGGALYDSTVP